MPYTQNLCTKSAGSLPLDLSPFLAAASAGCWAGILSWSPPSSSIAWESGAQVFWNDVLSYIWDMHEGGCKCTLVDAAWRNKGNCASVHVRSRVASERGSLSLETLDNSKMQRQARQHSSTPYKLAFISQRKPCQRVFTFLPKSAL